ncbi:MAG: hypothetical protein K0R71_1508 [Bacillales bacterium]|nr:hypothetical protein [Bacillales bacterium]
MNREIKVTGRGKISVPPDLVRIQFGIETRHPTYQRTIEQAINDFETLKNDLQNHGFKKEDFKTIRFEVRPEFESYQEGQVWKSRFIGYVCEHIFKIEFPISSRMLSSVIDTVVRSRVRPTFQVFHTLKDTDQAKNYLIAKAVEDSRRKAEILCYASGVSLGAVNNIDYSWSEIEIRKQVVTLNKSAMIETADKGVPMLDITADDIVLEDTVTVTWEIHG